jgi:type IV pilus assembly protein PilB
LGFTEKEMKKTTFYQATGCDECGNGYKSRTAIHEVLPFTNEIRQLILQASDELDEDAIRKSAIKNGMTTLRQAARKLAIEGRTTLQEVVAVTTD